MRQLLAALSMGIIFCVGWLPASTIPDAVGLPMVRLASGEMSRAGQVIVKLRGRVRDQLAPTVASGLMHVGVPGIDELCRRWRVTGFEPIVRSRNPALIETGADRLYLVRFDPTFDVEPVVTDFGRLAEVEYAGPNLLFRLEGRLDRVPDDSLYRQQWYLPRIRAPQAWDCALGDSSVLLAVIDDGLQYNHEDIRGNVRVNPAEDVNHNGRFDPSPPPEGDLDGIDQDSNGYVDDVIGYDFLDDDPDPIPGSMDDHGTFCWGVANAVTGNGIGISAPPWNVRGMALRCGGSGYIALDAAIAAIYYAIGEGAWAVSMSWGGRTPSPVLEAACEFIRTSGRLAVAAAGGSDLEPNCPGAYPSVLAVTASDSNDMKAPFAAYGAFVDLCAPGLRILGPVDTATYAAMDGTSASAPLVAGILGWLKSAYPEVTGDSAWRMLRNWCDTMPDTLYRQGLLGAGRVAMTPMLGGVADGGVRPGSFGPPAGATIVRGVLELPASGIARRASRVILDITGRRVPAIPQSAFGNPQSVDVSRLAPGVYFIAEQRPGRPGFRMTTRISIVP